MGTLPFSALVSLLESAPLSTDDGRLLRQMALDSGALHLVLSCMGALTHQGGDQLLPGMPKEVNKALKNYSRKFKNKHNVGDQNSLKFL